MKMSDEECKNWEDHQWTEIYYGHECERCGLFYPFGCAPWDMIDDFDNKKTELEFFEDE